MSAAAGLLGLRVRIPPGVWAWMFVSCKYCVLYRQRPLQRTDPSSRGVSPNVYIPLSTIRRNNNCLHLQWLGRKRKENLFLRETVGACSEDSNNDETKKFQAFLIHLSKCPSFSTIPSCAPNVTLWRFFLKFKSNLVVKRAFFFGYIFRGNLYLNSSVNITSYSLPCYSNSWSIPNSAVTDDI